MILTRTSDPAVEPVTLTEAKSHLRVDIDDDDTLITSLITTAREYVELAARRALITQTWRYSLDEWPDSHQIEIPRPPLQSVSSIVYIESDGTSNTWTTDEYDVDTDREPGRVVLAYGESWPSETLRPMSPIQITFVAGYGSSASDVPEIYRQAVLLLVGHWYENREATAVGPIARTIPLAVKSLLGIDRTW